MIQVACLLPPDFRVDFPTEEDFYIVPVNMTL